MHRIHRLLFPLLTAAVLLTTPMRPAAALVTPATGGVGEMAPAFNLENVLDAAPDFFSPNDFRGSVIVIFFFAWW